MLLKKEDYINKLIKLIGTEEENRNLFIKNNQKRIDEMYNEYVANQGRNVELSIPLQLDKQNHMRIVDSFESKNASFASSWVVLPSLQKILIKNILTKKYLKEQRFKCLCNHIVCPEISEALGMESARYYMARNNNEACLVTPSFINESEVLISGKQINSRRFGMRPKSTEEDIENIELFINSSRGTDEDVEKSRQAYIKQTVFWYIIDNMDQADRNWGVIQDDDCIRYAPNFDYDFCFGTDSEGPDTSRINDKNIESIINKFKSEPWFSDWFEKQVLKLDCKKAFESAKKLIPENHHEDFNKYKASTEKTINRKISRMKQIYMPIRT